MLNMYLSKIALVTKGKLKGVDASITSLSIDSRLLQRGGLFVAIKGEVVDGHDYLQQAMDKGAAGALVERHIDHPLPQIVVANVIAAMADIACEYRQQYHGKIISVTGSSGKTSTKEMLVNILSGSGNVIATKGNQNNEIGVPLTLFNLDQKYEFAVVEMGAAQQGDIAYLMHIVQPHVVVITNVGSAHIGRFGSELIIAKTKAEIYTESAPEAHAVVNLDDKYANEWLALLDKKPIITYSCSRTDADVYATDIKFNTDTSSFLLHFDGVVQKVILAAPGLHNIANALCASACAFSVGSSIKQVGLGLNAFCSVKSRLQKLQGCWGGVLIDDCYNANPLSVRAAIDVLANYASNKILVLGDMGELGDETDNAHQQVGEYAKSKGVNVLLTCGVKSAESSRIFGSGAIHFNNKKMLNEYLQKHLVANDVVLVKGSRSAALEEIVQSIMARVAV